MPHSATSNDSVSSPSTMVFSPQLPPSSPRSKPPLPPIDVRPTTIYRAPSNHRRIQSDGQDDSSRSSSPGSQGHPPPVVTSLPATPSFFAADWATTVSPRGLQRASSNPTIGTPTSSPLPLRRRLSSSPPPSRLQTIPIEPLRRQGSGADLSPIDECRASECDGKRKVRLEREARERDEMDRLRRKFAADGSEDEVDDADKMEKGRNNDRDSSYHRAFQSTDMKPAGPKKNKLGKSINVGGERSYGRVFDDPLSSAVVLLLLPFCPPLSVYLTFRECGGMNRHRVRELGVCVLLTVLGWVPGVVYALVVYFRHLPRPVGVEENQASRLLPSQVDKAS